MSPWISGLAAARIVAIDPDIDTDAPELAADGGLLVPGFVETHLHLDKTCILDRCPAAEGSVAEAVRLTAAAKKSFTPEDVYARGRKTLERAISWGTTRIRTHVEVDPGIGMRGFEGVQQLARDYAWATEIELCVFPQEGLLNNPGTEALLEEGLRRGRPGDRRGSLYRHGSTRPDRPDLQPGPRLRRRYRYAPGYGRHGGGDAGRVCLPQDGGVWLGAAVLQSAM